jgi:flagellar hook-associated protein 2
VSSVGMFSIGGIASGLDTSGIIEQLMQLERIPVTRMQSTQQQLRARDDAWGQVNTKLSTLRAAIDRIDRPDRFSNLVKVTSSNEDAVAVTARSGAGTGSSSFSVTQLAQAHQLRGEVVADPDAVLGGTSFAVTGGGTTVEVDLTGGKSLHDVARELNAAKAGFTASVVQTGSGEHRLVLSSASTGLDAALTVATDSAAGGLQLSDLQVARDAVLTMGSGAGAIEVTRSSNTIDDLVPGASITLKRVTAAGDAPVTVTSTQDVDGAVAAVEEYTKALSGAIELLAKLTKSDPAAAGILAGDSTARRMLDQLRSAVTAPTGLPTDGLHAAFQVGLSVDRYGAVTLDETKLKAALEQDFDGVARLFGNAATASASGVSVTTTAATAPGNHEVQITQAATRTSASALLATSNQNPADPTHFRLTVGERTVDLELPRLRPQDPDPDVTALAQQFNDALAAAGITEVAAAADAGTGELRFTATRYGSQTSFTIEAIDAPGGEPVPGGTVFGLENVTAGLDVAGTIAGTAFTGEGQRLTATSGPATGLSVTWTGVAGGDPFTVTHARGLAGGMSEVLRGMEGSGGSVARARQGLTSQIKIYQDRIDGFDVRLATRESTLRRQFTAMETALATLNSQGGWLQSQLAGLQNLHAQR